MADPKSNNGPQAHEPRPDPVALTQNSDPSKNASTGVDYEPHPPGEITNLQTSN